MAGDPFTPEEIAFINEQVWKMIVNNGVDYNPLLVITPDTPVDWSKVRMLVVDDRDPANSKTCNVDLKHVLDAYGVNVEKLSQEVKAAMQQLTTEKAAVTAIANQVTTDKGEVATNTEAVRGIKTTLDTETVPHINNQKEAVDLATEAAKTAARNAETSATNSSNEAIASAGSAKLSSDKYAAMQAEAARMDALVKQMSALASRQVETTVMIEGKLYTVHSYIKDGRTYHKMAIVK